MTYRPPVSDRSTASATQRIAGVAVVLVAVLGVVLLTRVEGTRIAGTASSRPGATLPSVGDCVESVLGPFAVEPLAVDEPAVDSVAAPSVAFSSCAAPHVGEVIALQSTPAVTGDAKSASAGTHGPYADLDWCRAIAEQYRGHFAWRYFATGGDWWEPVAGQRFLTVSGAATQSPRQNRWSTCVVLAPRLESYVGSYLQALAEASEPAPFGRCAVGDAAGTTVSCLSPHRSQEFGFTVRTDPIDVEALATCRALIGAMTEMPDVTAGGALRVEVVTAPSAPHGSAPGSPQTASCRLITATEGMLTATLVGVGNHPLPWA